jgi:DNA repair photolyase
MTTHTTQEYTSYDRAIEHFNTELFDGHLPPFLLTLQRKRQVYGYFSPERFVTRTNNRDKTDEIALNPDGFIGLTDKAILSILVHEMVHCWQAHFGQPSRRGYHNREWAHKMRAVGLQPVAAEDARKMTGQAVTHQIVPGGPFDVAAEQLLATGFRLTWQSTAERDAVLQGEEEPQAARLSKVKYTCPQCGQNAWAKPQSHLLCARCVQAYLENPVPPTAPATLSARLKQFVMRPLLFSKAIGRREEAPSAEQPGDLTAQPTAQTETDPPGTYTTTYQTLYGSEPPKHVTWEESSADILSPGRGFMAAFDYTMQVQVGCPGGCLYCYVITGGMLAPAEVRGTNGQTWGFRVRNKQAVLPKLKNHLQRGTLADQTLYWSGVTDPYAASPALTHAIWHTFNKTPAALRPRRIVVQTRFRPDRDWALMAHYSETTAPADGGPSVAVSYSVGTDRNDLIAAWEHTTPRFEQRRQAIQTLRQAGIFVVATLSPLGLWHDLAGTLTQFHAWGVAYLTCLLFKERTPSANTPAPFLAYLRQHYPAVLDPAWQTQQLHTMQAIYGPERVLLGKQGFDSLARPHDVVQTA